MHSASFSASGLLRRRHPTKRNTLLVNITRLGDMLQATPTIAGIKAENPEGKVTVLVEKQFAEVCSFLPNIDEVLSIDLHRTVQGLAREGEGIVDSFEYVTEVIDDLKSRSFDYCLNMSSSGYTALLLRILGIPRTGGWTADDEGYRVIESDWARLFATSVFHQNRQFNSLNLVDVFRCSADVDQHPQRLLMQVSNDDRSYALQLLHDAGLGGHGPLIAIQAGASQGKRQWAPRHFVELIHAIQRRVDARIALIGTSKELPIIEPIKAACPSKDVQILAGRTNIPQLGAILAESKILVTGDTGPMHMAVAVGTPVVAMFLASAYGYETGPYSEGNLVLQPVIACGPCNPNKPCARPDCHDTIDPEALAELTVLRMREDVKSIPEGLVNPNKVILYRTSFDQFGFYDMQALSPSRHDGWKRYRDAYRTLWLDDIGGLPAMSCKERTPGGALAIVRQELQGLERVIQKAQQGTQLIQELIRLIQDPRAPARALGELNQQLSSVDREIEEIGFNEPPLGPLTRMFIFAKENLKGSEALELASQMKGVYSDLKRRSEKFATLLSAA